MCPATAIRSDWWRLGCSFRRRSMIDWLNLMYAEIGSLGLSGITCFGNCSFYFLTWFWFFSLSFPYLPFSLLFSCYLATVLSLSTFAGRIIGFFLWSWPISFFLFSTLAVSFSLNRAPLSMDFYCSSASVSLLILPMLFFMLAGGLLELASISF